MDMKSLNAEILAFIVFYCFTSWGINKHRKSASINNKPGYHSHTEDYNY